MAGQGIFFKAPNFLQSCRILINNRLPHFNQAAGVKHKVVDKLKELKIPDKPKRPLTPFFKFIQEHRSSILKQHPDWKITQISSQCAADWKAINPSTKEQYENEYKTEMEQYAEKYLKYTKNLTEQQKEALEEYKQEVKKSKVRRERKKKIRENDRPKRPIGPYMLFVMEQAKSQPSKNYMELVKESKNKWAELSENEKSKYIDIANEARLQHEKDLKAWELRMIKEGKLDLVRQNTLSKTSPKSSKQ